MICSGLENTTLFGFLKDSGFMKDLVPLVISSTALFITYLNYSRDQAKINFSAFVGYEMPLNAPHLKNNGLYISVLNYGRRPISIRHIGFVADNFFYRILNKFDQRRFPEHGTTFHGENVKDIFIDGLGNSRLLKEAEEAKAVVQLVGKDDLNSLLALFKKNYFMHVTTSSGKIFKLRGRQYKRIIIDLEDMLKA